mmetsp:Transcript_28001/g.69077  ORF Transcript_28001/g.69077 Transcript_28001/m.69077 type:complete len:345 (-) Transcript_28001:915-1949(-)
MDGSRADGPRRARSLLLAALLALPTALGHGKVEACAGACEPRLRTLLGTRGAQRRAAALMAEPHSPSAPAFVWPPLLSACNALCLRNASAASDITAAAALLELHAPRSVKPCLFVKVPRTGSASVRLSLARDSWGVINIEGAYVPSSLLAEAAAGERGASIDPLLRSQAKSVDPPRPQPQQPHSVTSLPYGQTEMASIGWAVRGYRSASEIRSVLGLHTWERLITFATVRSPFERALAHAGATSPNLSDVKRCSLVSAYIKKATAREKLVLAAVDRYTRSAAEAAASRASPDSRVSAAIAGCNFIFLFGRRPRLRVYACTGMRFLFLLLCCNQMSDQPLLTIAR